MPGPLSPQAALAAVEAIRQHFAARLAARRETPEITEELERVLALLAAVDFSQADTKHLQASGHPVVRQLRRVGAPRGDAPAKAIFQAFLPHLEALPWRYSYAPRPDAPDIGERMAWAELVGPIAPFHSDKVCLGLTAIGPGLLYPLHYHPAVETYLVVSGTAAWTADGVTRQHPPGTLILHPANLVHAMQAGDEPLLAAYAWTGEVETLSMYV
ncbi:MAG: cupin domain-containing protein [Zoogloeaceae bacterium]|jgi:quercetin dioxygenase-like cupin family protein|nr:cupin domain-containing protein [Zoogloeaceae bacterium]